MSQTFDPAVAKALESAIGHGPPLEDAEWRKLKELTIHHARDLTGIERCAELTMLFVLGCDAVDIKTISRLTSLKSLVVTDSGLTSLDGMGDLSLMQFDISQNLVTDLTPLLSLRNVQNLDTIGNPLTVESYDEVLPELRGRGMYITSSDRSEWELTLRMQEAGLPFICYRADNILRLASPGFRLTKLPDYGHSAVTEDELRKALDEDPQRVYRLFDRKDQVWSLE
ncbi:hypothetical protein [Amycolatopsis sp. NPDC051371]|uniref:hypothetical protein n=1 Tax=Amycolatopsis sp. NPDC051371 TaxID=3155800 RepID=UPI003445F8C3